MLRPNRLMAGLLLCGWLVAAPGVLRALAAEGTQAPSPATRGSLSLKVDLTISRYQGTKKISSMPYALIVIASQAPPNANPSSSPNSPNAALRMGVNVYTGRAVTSVDNGQSHSNPEYQYIGTDVDCRADYSEGGYRVWISVSDSSLMPAISGDVPNPTIAVVQNSGVRRFVLTNILLLRDGVPVQFSVGTDPINGDSVRAEITATAVK